MVNRVFRELIENVIDAYVDDMVVKSVKTIDHVACLQKVFDVVRHNNLKFNPEKCVFGIASGKFLGFMITQRRIKTQEFKESLESLKKSLQRPPILTNLCSGDVLCLYLVASPRAVSAVLVKELPKAQKSIYYVSQVLKGTETRYSLAEQLVLVLIVAARKPRPYFQSHAVQVITDQPIKQILHRPKIFGRLQKWAIEINEFNIEFRPTTAIKAQGSGAGIIIIGPDSEELEYSLCFEFLATNNDVEYEAVITGLGLATRLGVASVEVCSDSKLIVGQVSGEYEVKDGRMAGYLIKVRDLQRGFASFKMVKVSRRDNERADCWAEVKNIEHEESWMDPIIKYLAEDMVPKDPLEARRLKARATSFTIIDGQLYNQGFTLPYLKYIRPSKPNRYCLRYMPGPVVTTRGQLPFPSKFYVRDTIGQL
ncbi:uncharacterized protein LOC111373864 [Olea europaea var. sylvestris]|uniref:uncharacterized protein LOC111373864 n=1 Tax=Olea europaea var. sylvestris TaxID=158386 RepID=UPI000C1D6227|nr:uncharacterized protein LOC111373864 [Olea europaea var. sylvestris]